MGGEEEGAFDFDAECCGASRAIARCCLREEHKASACASALREVRGALRKYSHNMTTLNSALAVRASSSCSSAFVSAQSAQEALSIRKQSTFAGSNT